MGIFSKFFKSSDDEFPTKNKEIINARKILRNSSLSDAERSDALAKLKSVFLFSVDKDDLKAISQSILRTAIHDERIGVRESALKAFDVIIDNCLFFYNRSNLHEASQLRLSVLYGDAMPALLEIARYKNEPAKELRRMAFWALSKLTSFASNATTDEHLSFLAQSLKDPTDDIRAAVISAFENLVKLSDDGLKRRIVRFSLSALNEALSDSTIWVRIARVLGGLGRFALGAVPFLFKRLDDENGEWAAIALRNITGEEYGKDEKAKWQQWLQKRVVEE